MDTITPQQIEFLRAYRQFGSFRLSKENRTLYHEALKSAANFVEPGLGKYIHLYLPKGKRHIVEEFFQKLARVENTMDDPMF